MARKRKNRTHLKGVNRDAVNEVDASAPKSFVIKSGIVGHSVTQLVRDIRKIMEPHTASRLRERASARLRDYLAMAPALKVSHLMALTLSPTTSTVHMRVARLPAGPTLTFRVERYSLMKDLTMAKSKYVGHPPSLEAFRTPPLLVLSNFNPPPGEAPKPQLKLMSTMFQGMFPPIQIDKSALPSFRRVLLISYHTDSATLSLRHYIITIRATGVSRRVRRVLDASATSSTTGRKPLDLTNDQDISDYLLGLRSTGYDTASESEGDSEAEGSDTGPGQSSRKIELPADYGRSKKGETKAVRLVEVGPRIEMKLGKVVEGVVGGARGEGETVWHERIHKSASEKTQLKSSHATKAAAKAARRAEQEANVARKKAELAAKEALKTSKRGKRPTTAEEEAEDEGGEESDGDEVVHDYEGEDEFEFEDRVAAAANNNKKGKQAATSASDSEGEEDVEDEDGMADWDGDAEADEGSSEEDEPELDEDAGESSDEGEEVAPRPARPRPTKKVRK